MKFVLSLLLILLSTAATAQSILRFQARITPQAIRLGDVLRIDKDQAQWAELKLDSRPQAGERLNNKQVLTWLERRVGPISYQWKGKTSTIIQPVIQSKGKALVQKAQSALRHALSAKAYDSVEIIPKSMPNDSALPLNQLTISLPALDRVTKRVCVRLNQGNQSIPIWFAVKTYQSVFIAKHTMQGHHQALPSDFRRVKRDIAGLKEKSLTTLPATMWLQQSIGRGHILTLNDLGEVPVVQNGDQVEVKIRNNAILITTKAQALQDGYLGDRIRLINPQSHHSFQAVITATNQAEIES